jgi:cell fate regulator YaaT (PSP1 superfamily)
MVEVIGVRFKKVGKVYYFDPEGVKITPQDSVIVEPRGARVRGGGCGNHLVDESKIIQPLKKVIRVATPEDYDQLRQTRRRKRRPWASARPRSPITSLRWS